MKHHRTIFLSIAILLGLGTGHDLLAQPLPSSRPEQQGVSSIRLERMREIIKEHVDDGNHAGAIWLVARRGRVLDSGSYGMQDLETGTPMATNTICRIYSMTKILTSVAVLQLVEQGRLGLEEPVGDHIPQLKNPRILSGGTVEAPEFKAAEKPITVKHLLTHTSGLVYAFLGRDTIHQIYGKADLWNADSLEAFMAKVADLPLAHEPGEAFTYGINTDVLGYLVQVVSGQPFEEYLHDHILQPLNMVDTGFYVPAEKRIRLAKIYEHREGKLRRAQPILGAYAEEGSGFPSGGGGLFSTVTDYSRFAQALLNDGRLGRERILGRKTVEWMRQNFLEGLGDGTHQFSDAYGFGLGVEVRTRVIRGGVPGSIGQYGWSGAATTYCNLDPRERTLVLLFVQHVPFNEHGLFQKFSTTFYQSLIDNPSPGAAAPRY